MQLVLSEQKLNKWKRPGQHFVLGYLSPEIKSWVNVNYGKMLSV